MGIIDLAELAGARFSFGIGENIVCTDCLSDKELGKLTDDESITNGELENAETKAYFCDRCKERM